MNASINSIVGFSLTAKHHNATITQIGTLLLKANHFVPPSKNCGLRKHINGKRWGVCLSVANGDHTASDIPDQESQDTETSISNIKLTATNIPTDSSPRDNQAQANLETKLGLDTEVSTGSIVSSDLAQNPSSANVKSAPRRSPLTAREKLRAARVLSRYSDSKTSKPEFGSKVLEALRESDQGKKRSGLPEAPTNLFDDSKRGMPKPGWTFEFPGGFDVFIVLFSFVFISTVMFATTYIVWKVGAIHFDEY